jgi:transcriptional regulator with XRE-family HTH domain
MSQRDVAAKLGVPKRTYINWEAGRRLPDALVVADLCRLLGAAPGDVLSAVPEVPVRQVPPKRKRGRKPQAKDEQGQQRSRARKPVEGEQS